MSAGKGGGGLERSGEMKVTIETTPVGVEGVVAGAVAGAVGLPGEVLRTTSPSLMNWKRGGREREREGRVGESRGILSAGGVSGW